TTSPAPARATTTLASTALDLAALATIALLRAARSLRAQSLIKRRAAAQQGTATSPAGAVSHELGAAPPRPARPLRRAGPPAGGHLRRLWPQRDTPAGRGPHGPLPAQRAGGLAQSVAVPPGVARSGISA